MILAGKDVSGHFHHWGGTAFLDRNPDEQRKFKTERLLDVVDENTHFVKIDTDGYDVEILTDSLEWLAAERPAVLFENAIKNDKELVATDSLFDSLKKIGYEYFIVWDDRGFQCCVNYFHRGDERFEPISFQADAESVSAQS